MYDSETWTISKERIKRLEAMEMRCYRRMSRASWTQLMEKEEVLQSVGGRRQLIKTLGQRQLKFLGHAFRVDGLEKRVMIEGEIDATISQSKQRKMIDCFILLEETIKIS